MHLRLKRALCARNYVVSLGDVRYKVAEVGKERETREHMFQCMQPIKLNKMSVVQTQAKINDVLCSGDTPP